VGYDGISLAVGRYSQSFPSFGSERMGASVKAYVRFDEKETELREPVIDPDVLIVQDETLFNAIDVFSGLKFDGHVLINTRRSPADLGIGPVAGALPAGHVHPVSATDLALKYLKRPTLSTALLGAFAARTDFLEMDAVVRAITEQFLGKIGEMNVTAARAALATVAEGKDAWWYTILEPRSRPRSLPGSSAVARARWSRRIGSRMPRPSSL
jgi:pyruvate ferredoxin oxidoreductase gamma subunit